MVGVARHGARLAKIGKGDTVLVLGLGMIGQMSTQAALRRGARVVAGDLLSSRVQAAQRTSAAITLDLSAERLSDAARREAPEGVDVVIDTTGVAALFDTLVDVVRREGTILLQGYYPDLISVPFHRTHLKRPCVIFPCGWDGPEADTDIAADLQAQTLKIGPLITHRYPYQDAKSAYDVVLNSPETSLGMVFDWR
jgi:2-desacetyl-2-hydroxyethyl bacteriochlorophyllide A dehydrogenase